MALFLIYLISILIQNTFSYLYFAGIIVWKKKLPLNQSWALVLDFYDPTDYINIFIKWLRIVFL